MTGLRLVSRLRQLGVIEGTEPVDGSLLHDIVEESDVVQDVADPSLSEYVGYLFSTWVRRLLAPLDVSEGFVRDSFTIFAWVVVGSAVLLLLYLLVRRWIDRSPRRRTRDASDWERGGEPGRGVRIDWQARLDELLGAGSLREALEALWWQLAAHLVPQGVPPSWTARDLLEATGAKELAPALETLDRLRFRAEEPVAAEIDRLRADLRRLTS